MARTSRPKKSALNQTTVKISEEDIEKVKEYHDIDLEDEAREMISEETGKNPEDVIVVIDPKEEEEETESPQYPYDNEVDGDTEIFEEDPEPQKLSRDAMRRKRKVGAKPRNW
jgi:hypothetical protein